MSDAKKRDADEATSEIQKVDAQLLVLLERRAQASVKLSAARAVGSLPTSFEPIVLPADKPRGLLDSASLHAVLAAVRASCAPIELQASVAFVGSPGSMAHIAAQSRFGMGANLVASEDVKTAISEVFCGRAGFAVVPYEMRPYGPVDATIRELVAHDVRLVACFGARENVDLASKAHDVSVVERIFATAQERAACEGFLAREFPKAAIVDVKTTVHAMERAEMDLGSACLASRSCAEVRGLLPLRANVRDAGDERLRYAVVGTRPAVKTGNDLTALVLSVHDTPGSLHQVLHRFAEREINLTKIESRPTNDDAWDYLFFIEIVGHATDRHVLMALDDVKRQTKLFKILGSYAREV
jgi:chorismate mutase / prephenate dehydratase